MNDYLGENFRGEDGHNVQPQDFNLEFGADSSSSRIGEETPPPVRVKVGFETSDIIAVACLIIAIGAVIVATLAIMRPPSQLAGTDIVEIIVACVGTAGISGIAAVLVKKRKKRNLSAMKSTKKNS